MSDIPIIRMGQHLLLSLQGELDDTTVVQIETLLTREVERISARGVLLDVSGLAIIDSFIARVLARIVDMIRLLGGEAVVVGMQPAVAMTLVDLGLALENVPTALNAEQGMAILRRTQAGLRHEQRRPH